MPTYTGNEAARAIGRRTVADRKMKAVPHVRDREDEIRACLRDAKPAAFLDYDGTLTPIVDDPEDAVLAPATRAALERLAQRYIVGVVSGRDLTDVRDRVGLDTIVYAGSHGFDISGPGGWRERPGDGPSFLADLEAAETRLRDDLKRIEVAAAERKAFSIAVHHRGADADGADRVERVVDRVLRDHPRLRKGRGKEVLQIGPDTDWDKGAAVRWLLEAFDLERDDVLPLYIGDDVTDEDAFRALRGRGIGIVVCGGDRETAADYALDNPAEVEDFLEALLAWTGAGSR